MILNYYLCFHLLGPLLYSYDPFEERTVFCQEIFTVYSSGFNQRSGTRRRYIYYKKMASTIVGAGEKVQSP